MIRVFLDTEFTGLGQRRPRLISIGLVSEDGRHEFYAELTAEGYLPKVTPWVRENILPLLEGGDRIMLPRDLCQRLADWIGGLGQVRIVGDTGIGIDMDFLRSILSPWPNNVDPKPIIFHPGVLGGEYAEAIDTYRGAYFTPDKPEHHALHDARALRQAWQRARFIEGFSEWIERTEQSS